MFSYDLAHFFDEAFEREKAPRSHYQTVIEGFIAYGESEFQRRRSLIELVFRNQGITFTVYGDERGTERTFPFDPFPRIITASEWTHLEAGLKQRVKAINMFLRDIYHEQEILKDDIIPAELVLQNPNYRKQVKGIDLPHDVYTHIVGCDLIRDAKGSYRVLEDNLRSPSGVSYMLANRGVMARSFPKLLEGLDVRPISHYPLELLKTLRSLSDKSRPSIVVLTPGQYNSAYFEHSYLAQQMGVQLVEGRDLFVADDYVWMRTTNGREKVDVIYRRIDDNFLDPQVFNKESMLGVAGILEVYKKGNVALANAIGTGVADDKATYAYIPRIIKYYLNEEPIIPNVETFLGAEPEGLEYMLHNAEKLVIKEVGGAGGYGMLVGSEADEEKRKDFLAAVRADPKNYIAQPIIQLSRHPTYYPDSKRFEPCHVDLRPYILMGEEITIVPGGLTRVALKRGSLVVNSSQGGGSKDTWVLADA
ncbi:MAG: circularly permuted type 2 ATP-grasp protein [Trueperaceae bacterium]|nr:circularly permuted type 2 ATP-grasp protein [Trueperaceae bacterium]